MSVALKDPDLWDPVNFRGTEYAKGAANYHKDCQTLMAMYSVLPNDVLYQIIEKKSSAKESWEAVKAMYQEHPCVQGTMKSYDRTMESHGLVLMNDKVEPELYTDRGVRVDPKNWYLDAGASNHMTGTRALFDELDESVHGLVVFNKGYVMEIKGRGPVRLQCKNGEQRVWSEVYFVPSLCANIISLSSLKNMA